MLMEAYLWNCLAWTVAPVKRSANLADNGNGRRHSQTNALAGDVQEQRVRFCVDPSSIIVLTNLQAGFGKPFFCLNAKDGDPLKTPNPQHHAKSNQKVPVLLVGGCEFHHLAGHADYRGIRAAGNHGTYGSGSTAVQHTFAQCFLFRNIFNPQRGAHIRFRDSV